MPSPGDARSGDQMARMTAREKAFVTCMCFTITVCTSNWAIMATFFPIWASDRGMRPLEVSIIFTAFQVGKLVMSIAAGHLANRFGRRTILVVGIGIVSATGVSIGITPELAGGDTTVRTLLFSSMRFVQGCGSALTSLSIVAILSDTFRERRGLMVGLSGAMEAAGYFVGPPIGGWLYALSGFQLPFLSLAGLVAINLACIFCLHPKRRLASDAESTSAASMACADNPGSGLATADSSAQHPDGATVGSSTRAMAADSSGGGGKEAPPSWRRDLARLPLEIWWTGVAAAVYMSKWAWCARAGRRSPSALPVATHTTPNRHRITLVPGPGPGLVPGLVPEPVPGPVPGPGPASAPVREPSAGPAWPSEMLHAFPLPRVAL